jgi:F-type H+-transporting ATPase subunit b
LEQLGINPTFLLAQIVNFLVLWFLLSRFLFPATLKTLAERRNRIRDSLAEAERVKQETAATRADFERQLAEERRKVQEAIAQAARVAEEVREKIIAEAQTEAEQIKAQAREEIGQEREQMLVDLRRQIADLAILAAQKVIGRTLDERAQRQLIQDFLAQAGDFS